MATSLSPIQSSSIAKKYNIIYKQTSENRAKFTNVQVAVIYENYSRFCNYLTI